MTDHDDELSPNNWKDEAHKFFRHVVAVIDEYQDHVVPDSTAGVILADLRFGAMTLAEQIVRGEAEAALRSITGLRDSIAELLRSTD